MDMSICEIEDQRAGTGIGQWPFKAIFQKAIVRLGRLVAFEWAAKIRASAKSTMCWPF